MNIFELTQHDLTKFIENKFGKGDYHSKAIYRELIKKGNTGFENVIEFQKSKNLAQQIKEILLLPVPTVSKIISEKETIKFTLRLKDNYESESVIIPMKNHNTLCISSQIGCKMGCIFCETGKMGFIRNLTVSEIVSQVYTARFVLKKTIKNLVFMGMGEPFDNFNNVIKAIDVLNDQRGFDFAHRHITISTAGIIKGIERLGALNYKNINLAISLNAPSNTIRTNLMPINNKYPLEDLVIALKGYPLKKRGAFFIEYVVIPGINNSEKHADEVVNLLKDLKVRVNLIPLNKTSDFHNRVATDKEVHQFAKFLEAQGLFVVKRWSKGDSFFAACGQLGNKHIQTIENEIN